MDQALINQLALGLTAVALLVSGVFGGRPERIGCVILVVGIGVTWLAQAAPGAAPVVAFLLIDLAVGAGFAVLLFKTKLLWPGVAACAQLLLSAFNATRLLDFPLSEESYIMVLQLSSVLVAGALIFGAGQRRFPGRQEAW